MASEAVTTDASPIMLGDQVSQLLDGVNGSLAVFTI